MAQNQEEPEGRGTERRTVSMSMPKLVGLAAGVAAVAVAATLVLSPKQSTTVPQQPATQQTVVSDVDKVAVPDVVGLERQSAEKVIANAKLDMGKEKEEYSETVHAGCVISQDPASGTFAEVDSKVNIVISKGRKSAPETTMPDLTGKTREDAEKAITDARLIAVQGADVVSNKVKPGLVCEQSVAAGTTLKQDTYVSYSIAIAPPNDSTSVPNVAGEPVKDAREQLHKAYLGVDTSKAYSDTVAKDCVIKQSIDAGTKVAKGTVVSLTVSMGKKPSGDIEVPDVVGKNSGDAASALKNAGLSVSTTNQYSDDVAKDIVMSQSISAGTKVAKDTPITIVVSMGPRQDGSITVPDVAGWAADDAEAELVNVGLKSERSETYSDTVEKGDVIGQSIPAGTKVAKDTVVTLTVSLGTKPEPTPPTPPTPPAPVKVQVPDIMTYTRDEAIEAIESAGLIERWSGEENGTVVSQDPPAGTEVDQGSVVTFKLEHVASKVEVPDVSGLSASDANVVMQTAGLALDYDDGQADWIVDNTDPVAGALVDEGTHVTAVFKEDAAPSDDSQPKSDDDQADKGGQSDEQSGDADDGTAGQQDGQEDTADGQRGNQSDDQAGDQANGQSDGQNDGQDDQAGDQADGQNDGQAGDQTNGQQDDQNDGQDGQASSQDDQSGDQSDQSDQADQSGDQSQLTGDKGNGGSDAADPSVMLSEAMDVAGASYQIDQTLTTQAVNDGVNYTFLCHDDTGSYQVVVHVPGTSGASASLVSVTPANG
ncbi:MAG: PASTA domain-containing protein [Atopobiaceae bacterium]|nr:PASTA domain-containing protein [Atopobiaceae bacterium]